MYQPGPTRQPAAGNSSTPDQVGPTVENDYGASDPDLSVGLHEGSQLLDCVRRSEAVVVYKDEN
jgi:hypothetical protein